MAPIRFDQTDLDRLLPPDRTKAFFEALFGDPDEGAYEISLTYTGNGDSTLHFAYRLTARPGQCLACHLTAGLPTVFRRHPIIDVTGTVNAINDLLGQHRRVIDWQLGETIERNENVHEIPLTISTAEA